MKWYMSEFPDDYRYINKDSDYINVKSKMEDENSERGETEGEKERKKGRAGMKGIG